MSCVISKHVFRSLTPRHQELEERSWLEVLCLVTGDVGVTIQLQLPGPGTFAEV